MNKKEILNLLNDRERLAKELPEVLELEKCEQLGPYHSEGDVLTHTKMVVSNLPNEADEELLWAGVLHDIAKPLTEIRKERDGEIVTQFIGHEKVGAESAYKITGRFGLKQTQREKIKWLVGNHMRIGNLPVMREHKAKEFVNHPFFPHLIELLKADLAGSIGKTEEVRGNRDKLIKQVEEIYHKWSGK